MATVMGQVAAPSEELALSSSLQSTMSPSLRGSSGSAPEDQDERDTASSTAGSRSILPGRNGFGHVSYDANTPASTGSSSSAAAAAAAAADARARIRHAGKAAGASSPDNLLKLRATF